MQPSKQRLLSSWLYQVLKYTAPSLGDISPDICNVNSGKNILCICYCLLSALQIGRTSLLEMHREQFFVQNVYIIACIHENINNILTHLSMAMAVIVKLDTISDV